MILTELEPGERGDAYHWDQNNETWLLVVEGALTVRVPDGEHTLEPRDLVCLSPGPGGAREVINSGSGAGAAAGHRPRTRPAPLPAGRDGCS